MFVTVTRPSANVTRHMDGVMVNLREVCEKYELETVRMVELAAGSGRFTDGVTYSDDYYLAVFKNRFNGIVRLPEGKYLYLLIHKYCFSWRSTDYPYHPEHFLVH